MDHNYTTLYNTNNVFYYYEYKLNIDNTLQI